MAGILFTGTSSDAGKSLLVMGICRALADRGIDVVPYKAQNMSNNSAVLPDGSEIGRAQLLQAMAARVEPSSAMNPVLLQPSSDRRSIVVLRGEPIGALESGEYTTGRRALATAAWDAYEELASAHDLVVCEGAGSPAEINLRAGDYTNMGLARRFSLPTAIIGDIDRGGVLASLYGTWGLLDDFDRVLLRGYIINKFRGDATILAPGLEKITELTGMAHVGTMPWLSGVWLDGEDSLDVERWRHEHDNADSLNIAVVRLPRISHSNDVDALAAQPGVNVRVVTDAASCAAAHLVIIPSTKAVAEDLAWLRETGIERVLGERARRGAPILAVGSGAAMLARTHDDVPGLGLLPMTSVTSSDAGAREGEWNGKSVSGFASRDISLDVASAAEVFLDGARKGSVMATSWHQIFDNDAFRQAWLAEVADISGSSWRVDEQVNVTQMREDMIRAVGSACEEYLELERMLDWAFA